MIRQITGISIVIALAATLGGCSSIPPAKPYVEPDPTVSPTARIRVWGDAMQLFVFHAPNPELKTCFIQDYNIWSKLTLKNSHDPTQRLGIPVISEVGLLRGSEHLIPAGSGALVGITLRSHWTTWSPPGISTSEAVCHYVVAFLPEQGKDYELQGSLITGRRASCTANLVSVRANKDDPGKPIVEPVPFSKVTLVADEKQFREYCSSDFKPKK